MGESDAPSASWEGLGLTCGGGLAAEGLRRGEAIAFAGVDSSIASSALTPIVGRSSRRVRKGREVTKTSTFQVVPLHSHHFALTLLYATSPLP